MSEFGVDKNATDDVEFGRKSAEMPPVTQVLSASQA